MPTHETFQFQGDPMTSPINDTHDMAIARCLALQQLLDPAAINEQVSRHFEALRELDRAKYEGAKALREAKQHADDLAAKLAAKNEALARARQRGDLRREEAKRAWRLWRELVAALGFKQSDGLGLAGWVSQGAVLARIEQLTEAAADFEEVRPPRLPDARTAWETLLSSMVRGTNEKTYEEQARAIFKELREVLGVRENDGISITDHVREVMRQRDLALADFKRKVETLASAEAQAEYAISKRTLLVHAASRLLDTVFYDHEPTGWVKLSDEQVEDRQGTRAPLFFALRDAL